MDNESRICQMCGNYIDQEMVLGESVWKVHEHVCQGCNVIGVFDREPGKHTIKRDTAGRTTHAVLTPLAKQE
jgi:hypothetical protein